MRAALARRTQPPRPHRIARWAISPEASAAFVACMEDVLGLYEQSYDPACPVVCLDEMPVRLLAHTREPLPMRPGGDLKEDHEYAREGIGLRVRRTRPQG